ncbi:hypothetical protein E1301_Tti009802 [Triplophysa tibetana]|uniref:Uncharacterized protein n=1 Tax=Triplophysa tibetana TaxID=1572043 RepID=A0A5A9N7Q5_9TELE|nr:hypothetical protein E1301_Tti009802 [Triplophysa tibetana]
MIHFRPDSLRDTPGFVGGWSIGQFHMKCITRGFPGVQESYHSLEADWGRFLSTGCCGAQGGAQSRPVCELNGESEFQWQQLWNRSLGNANSVPMTTAPCGKPSYEVNEKESKRSGRPFAPGLYERLVGGALSGYILTTFGILSD